MTNPTDEEKIVVDIDGNIKEAIDELLEDCLDFFLPILSSKVDYSVKPIAMQQEFQGIISFASGKKKIMDKLYYLTLKPVFAISNRLRKAGAKPKPAKKEIILLHTEAETSPKSHFVKRMFIYIAMAIAKHNKPITALVIYTGKKVPKRPNSYEMSCYGTGLSYWFNYYAIAEQNEADLIANKNIILAIKYVIDTPNDYAQRFAFKKKLFGLLLERNYPLEKRRKLLTFVKEILRLPKDLERDFIKFAYSKVEDSMKTKNQEMTVKERLKQTQKEWAELFAEMFYDSPIQQLLRQERAEERTEVRAEADKKMQGVVLHLYHTIGLSEKQIAESLIEPVNQIV